MNFYMYLAIALLAGLLAGKVMKKFKLPNVTGYIIIGLLVGPYCFKLIPSTVIEQMAIIPEVALGFIAFSIGAEFKLTYLKKAGKAPVIIATMAALVAVLFVDVVLIAMGNDVPFSIVLGSIAAATAPAATLMVVRQYKAKGPVTDTLLPVVAIDDAVAIMLFGISIAIAKGISSRGTASLASTLLHPVIEIGGALIFGAILGYLLKFLSQWFTGRGNRLSIAIALILLCIGVSNLLGLSSLLACMTLSGVFVNVSKNSNPVFEQVDRFTPPVFILFFFISGAELDLTILPTVGVIGIMYILFRSAGKILGSALSAKMSGTEPTVTKYLGYTLLPQAGVAIGLTNVAMVQFPEYGNEIRAVVLCATVIYELSGPVITKIALKKAGEIS